MPGSFHEALAAVAAPGSRASFSSSCRVALPTKMNRMEIYESASAENRVRTSNISLPTSSYANFARGLILVSTLLRPRDGH